MTIVELPPHPADAAAAAAVEPPVVRSMADAPLPTYESHSSISVYRGCPLRYAFRYIERRPGEVSPGQFAFGNAVHKAFEAFGRARIAARTDGAPAPDAAVLRTAFDRKIGSCGLEPEEVDASRHRAAPVLASFLERELTAEDEPVGVELGFGVDVAMRAGEDGDDGARSVRFVGYVDRVDRAPDGSTVIVDYKTGRRRTQDDVDADTQLTAYAYGCVRGGLRDSANGGEPLPPASRLGLYLAETAEMVWTTRTPVQLAAFEAALVGTVGRIHARAFEARPRPWRCRWCEYRNECPEVSPGT